MLCKPLWIPLSPSLDYYLTYNKGGGTGGSIITIGVGILMTSYYITYRASVHIKLSILKIHAYIIIVRGVYVASVNFNGISIVLNSFYKQL